MKSGNIERQHDQKDESQRGRKSTIPGAEGGGKNKQDNQTWTCRRNKNTYEQDKNQQTEPTQGSKEGKRGMNGRGREK